MPMEDIQSAQETFLQQGGLYVHALRNKRKKEKIGQNDYLPPRAEYQDYPKMISLSQGVQKVKGFTLDIDKKRIDWEEEKEVFTEIQVYSEEDEERVLSGGKTSAALEDDRQGLIHRCRAQGIKVDLTWSMVRLRRELGDKLDAPEQPNKMEALEAELAGLRKMAEMQAEIDRLKAQLAPAPVEDMDKLRQELADLGVTPDKRWGGARLREEREKATAPGAVAA